VEDDARTAKMDEWVIWGTEKKEPLRGLNCHLSFVVSFIRLFKGAPSPESCAQRTAGEYGFPLSFTVAYQPRAECWFPLFFLGHISLGDEGVVARVHKINKKYTALTLKPYRKKKIR